MATKIRMRGGRRRRARPAGSNLPFEQQRPKLHGTPRISKSFSLGQETVAGIAQLVGPGKLYLSASDFADKWLGIGLNYHRGRGEL
jgi:hypothetical protein